MSEVLLPPWIIPEDETHEWLDEGSSVFSSAFAPGLAQRQSYGGLRLKLSRRHTVRGEEKAQLLSILKQTRGRYNALRTKVHFDRRGSGFGAELLTNNTFSNGTTGWNADSPSGYTNTVSDRIYRATRIGSSSSQRLIRNASTVSCTQFAPHVQRVFVSSGLNPQSNLALGLGSSAGGAEYGSSSSGGTGHRSLMVVPSSTTISARVVDASTSGFLAGDYYDISWISVTACPIVDNGLNSLLQSDEFDTTWTSLRASVDDQTAGTTAPDGTSTADSIIEDSTNNTHLVTQDVTVSSAAADYAFSVALKAGARSFAIVQIVENTGSSGVHQVFNLSTGAVGSTGSTGTNWNNRRTFITSLGDGWYKCTVVARKTNAATSLAARIFLSTADSSGAETYTGDGTSNIYAWRATLVQSSVPTRLVQTTTTASTGTAQTGNALYLKGLTASTNGLLLPGDWLEINGELKQCAAPLNSDASGLGYLQFEPPLIRSPSNDDPIIVIDPMGKFLVSNIKIENEFGTQARVSYDLEHIYE